MTSAERDGQQAKILVCLLNTRTERVARKKIFVKYDEDRMCSMRDKILVHLLNMTRTQNLEQKKHHLCCTVLIKLGETSITKDCMSFGLNFHYTNGRKHAYTQMEKLIQVLATLYWSKARVLS